MPMRFFRRIAAIVIAALRGPLAPESKRLSRAWGLVLWSRLARRNSAGIREISDDDKPLLVGAAHGDRDRRGMLRRDGARPAAARLSQRARAAGRAQAAVGRSSRVRRAGARNGALRSAAPGRRQERRSA